MCSTLCVYRFGVGGGGGGGGGGAVERRWRWREVQEYVQALCVHDCTCICVYMIVCKYNYT